MGNFVKKSFTTAQNWTAPAGVRQIVVSAFYSRFNTYDGVTSLGAFVTPDYDAYCYGQNSVGNAGNGTFGATVATPAKVVGGYKFRSIYRSQTNGFNTYALDQNGLAWAWGAGDNGGLGDGTVNTAVSSPVAVVGGLRFQTLAPMGGGAIGLDFNGAAWAWGGNQWGQLGANLVGGISTGTSSPVAVAGGLTFVKIGASGNPSAGANGYGLTGAGQMYGWGIGAKGSNGDGTVTNRSSPVAVVGGHVFTDFAVTSFNSGATVAALKADGTVWAWGENGQGLIGDGTVVSKSSPVAVVGGLTFTRLGSSYGCFYGIQADGTTYAWGYNGQGQLGVGDVTSRSSPVALVGGVKFLYLPTSGGSSAPTTGLATDGSLYTWGLGNVSGMGDGTTTSKSSPVAVAGGLFGAPSPIRLQGKDFFQVTPGSSYAISFANGFAFFNGISVGPYSNLMTIEYFQ